MSRIGSFYLAWLMATVVCPVASVAESLEWEKLPPIPDRLGFAGPFVGSHNGALLVAGGANFPDKLPWEGGTKVWYDTVFVLEKADGTWKKAGKLPRPLGYGVSLTSKDGVLCIGGSDAQRHYAETFLIRCEKAQVRTEPLPPLPRPCANFCGALVGQVAYVAGGLETASATNTLKTFWSLDLSLPRPQWKELDPWPGPARMLATAAALDGGFFLASGADLTVDESGKTVRRYLKDAYLYKPGKGWKRLADLPRPAVAAPTPAPVLHKFSVLILGGDDGSLVNYQPLDQHPGFPRSIVAYSAKADTWDACGEMPAAHVTTCLTAWNGRLIIPSGEVRPGIRSPAVWSIKARRGCLSQ